MRDGSFKTGERSPCLKRSKEKTDPGPGPEPDPDPEPEPVDPPEPVPGSGEATDPQPTITAEESQNLTLVLGQKFNLGKGWSSSNNKILSVNSNTGAAKAKKLGSGIILTHKDGKHTIHVNIVKPLMSETKLKLEAGSEETLKINNAEGLAVIWTSSAPDVAVVEDGKVTAVAKGSAKITAKVNGKTLTITVKVTK